MVVYLIQNTTHLEVDLMRCVGAGAILSSGLMCMLDVDQVEDFISNRSRYQSGGENWW